MAVAKKIQIYDTTLRDGCQSEDVSLTTADKLQIAERLDDLGIDYIDKRNGLIDAVTMKDVKRVAKRLLEGGMLVMVVGRPQPPPAKGG